ncbi:hypothetical protein ACFP3U_19370 [Kitasatospora misakiensis]|uniref:Uncharacterized protein n=1 Tax=Kitasatospora misakiensis TaxID=67330 RepID=A0ABW0X5X7_9ACTN
MNTGGTNDPVAEDRELPTGLAVLITVLAAVCGALVLLVVLHGLGWTAPGLGWLVAKGAVKLGVGGTVGLLAAVGWLRTRREARRQGAA